MSNSKQFVFISTKSGGSHLDWKCNLLLQHDSHNNVHVDLSDCEMCLLIP